MGVSENRGPYYSTPNSSILILRTPEYGTPSFRTLPYRSYCFCFFGGLGVLGFLGVGVLTFCIGLTARVSGSFKGVDKGYYKGSIVGFCGVGAFIVRMGFGGVYYASIIIRKPQAYSIYEGFYIAAFRV